MTTTSTSTQQHDEDELIDVSQAAQIVGRSNFWVIEHTSGKAKPRLPFVRFGRKIQFQRKALREFIAAHVE